MMTDRECAFKQPLLAWLMCAPVVAAYILQAAARTWWRAGRE